ncbi:MAG: RrF2 family transcriptional regulator [Psychrobium sp.]
MNVTRFTDYSMRVLIYLAVKDSELVTIKEIAQSYDISKNHLMKVVQELNHKSYVTAIRGKNGGIKLAKSPDEINIGDVIRSVEQGSQLVECFGDNNICVITPACQLKTMLAEALEQFFLKLDEYTLADLISGQKSNISNLLFIKEL